MGKSIDTILSFQAILLAAFHVTFTNGGPLCLGCHHISLPRDCNRLIRCGDHEVCYVEQTVSHSGTIWYDSGCMSVTKCKSYGKRSPIQRVQTSLDLTSCLECCHGDYCNMAGCGTTGIHTGTSASLICFNCENHLDPNTCDLLTGCTDTESCYLSVEPSIITDQVFKSGCISKSNCLQLDMSPALPALNNVKLCLKVRKKLLCVKMITEKDATAMIMVTSFVTDIGICPNLLGVEIVGKRQNYGTCTGCCDTDFCNRNCSVLKHQHILSLETHSETTTQKTTHTQSSSTQTGTQTPLPQTQMAILSSSSTTHAPTTVSTRHTTLPAPPQNNCQLPIYNVDEQLNLCIYINHTRVTWEAAHATCRALGGDLLQHIDVPILNYLNNMQFYENDIFKERYWVGASDIGKENDWLWLDGSAILHKELLFHAGEPNDYNQMEDCGTVYHLRDDNGLKMNDDPCNASFPFICQFKLNGVHGCNNTEYTYVKELDLCYKIHKDNPTSWMEANLACQLEHAHLIHLKNISYENYLQKLNFYEHDDTHRYWIGASDLREEGTYEWINGLRLENLQWHAHEPNSFEGNEDCISLMYFNWDKSLMLNDDVCSKHLYYICQEVPRCRPDYTYVKDIDLCYKIHHESNYNWEQARTVCESEGSDLIVVDNLPLMQFLYRTLDNDVTNKDYEKYWIGATDKVQEGKFIWVNGQHVENNFWHPNEPNNAYGNENCVALWWYDDERHLGMNDVPCETYTMKFVCQMKW